MASELTFAQNTIGHKNAYMVLDVTPGLQSVTFILGKRLVTRVFCIQVSTWALGRAPLASSCGRCRAEPLEPSASARTVPPSPVSFLAVVTMRTGQRERLETGLNPWKQLRQVDVKGMF